MIADYLIAGGETVFHILGRKHLEQAHMTGAAKNEQTKNLVEADENLSTLRNASIILDEGNVMIIQ